MQSRSRIRVTMHRALMGIACLLILCFTAQAQDLPYRNPSLPVEQRVADLLSRMTLEEKVAQLEGAWEDRRFFNDPQALFTDDKGAFLPERAAVLLKNGLGEMSRTSVNHGPRSMAEFTNPTP